MGWLHSRPKMHDKDTSPSARAEQFPDGDPILGTPQADPIVVEAFVSCGLSQSTGMGESPVSWQEINAYSIATEIKLTAWEKKMVHMMSKEYLSYKSLSTKYRTYRTPYEPELSQEDIKARTELMRAVI